MYQENKKARSAVAKSRSDRPSSIATSREKLSSSILGLQEIGSGGSSASTETGKKDVDIGISAALLMAIRTKSRAGVVTSTTTSTTTSTSTSTTTLNVPLHDTDAVNNDSSGGTMMLSSPSERSHGEPRASAEDSRGQKTLPLTEHTTSTSSIQSEHSEDGRSCGSLTDLDFEGMTAEDWAKWSKEDLIKALLKTRKQLRGTDQELEALHNYLKKLLDRIIETNPELLQIS